MKDSGTWWDMGSMGGYGEIWLWSLLALVVLAIVLVFVMRKGD